MAGAIFEIEGGSFVPGPEARGLWYESALHGGPVAALFTRQFEQVATPVPMQLTRLTLDLMKPVPTVPLTVETRVVREGRRIQVLDGVMIAGGVVVARASALRMRVSEVAVPDHPRRPGPVPPAEVPGAVLETGGEAWFHSAGVEMRFASSAFWEPGPAEVWMRLKLPIVAGEDPSPLQRVTAVADFGNGVSHVLGWREYVFINPDLTVHIARPPVGEWVCLRSRTDAERQGIGLAQSELYDERGAIGHALQGLFLDTREAFDPG